MSPCVIESSEKLGIWGQDEVILLQEGSLIPFVKWAGGKRQLLPQLKERMPRRFHRYYEPFVGGGALLFDLCPEQAIINDCDSALINTYRQIRDDPNLIIQMLEILEVEIRKHGEKIYYAVRELYNKKLLQSKYDIELAAMFLFLNRYCFNGVYRVNRQGCFNVGYNGAKYNSVKHVSFQQISEYLKRVEILNGDFEDACRNACEGDFFFIDSPYVPVNQNSFDSYTQEGFSWSEHVRLAKLVRVLTARGCYCMLTNHDVESVHELYSERCYQIYPVKVKRLVNSDATKREARELIICNYRPEEDILHTMYEGEKYRQLSFEF